MNSGARSDTAGLRDTDDPVERIGVYRAKNALETAELVLALFDGTIAPTDEDRALLSSLEGVAAQGKKILYILTKKDLIVGEESPFLACLDQKVPEFLWLSAKKAQGMGALAAAVEEAFIDASLDTGASAIVFSARQFAALSGCTRALEETLDALRIGLPYDLCAEELRGALSSLGELSGHSVREEVISEIFHKFCVGK